MAQALANQVHTARVQEAHVESASVHRARQHGQPLLPGLRARAPRQVDTSLCAGCRAREARYGFRDREGAPDSERPRTLCFECFRVELSYRQSVADRLARGWNGSQAQLPLEGTLQELTRRRRRAQIAARHALGV